MKSQVESSAAGTAAAWVRKAVAVAAIALFAAGAKADDRVNLWPLYYRDADGFSAIWPIVSVSGNHYAVRPLYSCYYGTEHNVLWPIAQFDTATGDNRIFPVYWGKRYFFVFPVFGWSKGLVSAGVLYWHYWDRHKTVDTLFPLWWWESRNDGKDRTFWFAAGLGGGKWSRDSGIWEHWLHPFYYYDPDTFMSLLYFDDRSSSLRVRAIPLLMSAYLNGHGKDGFFSPYFTRWTSRDDGSTHTRLLMGLAGWNSPKEGEMTFWSVPFFYTSPDSFVSPLWISESGGDERYKLAPLLLSGWYGNPSTGESHWRFLLGMAGTDRDAAGNFESWCFPAYYKGRDMFITPLYGESGDSRWLFPVWYDDSDTFASAAWCHKRGEDGSIDWWMCPPLLSRYSYDRERSVSRFTALLGLAGCESGKDGLESHWFMPFYYHDANMTMYTPLAGRRGDSRWIAPLYYTDETYFLSALWCSESRLGGKSFEWCVPPLLTWYSRNGDFTEWGTYLIYRANSKGEFKSIPYTHRLSGGYEESLSMLDSATLDDSIKIWEEPVTNRDGVVSMRRTADRVNQYDKRTFMLLSDMDREVLGYLTGRHDDNGCTNYLLKAASKAGNYLVVNRGTERKVTYSSITREKTGDVEKDDLTVLLSLLYWSECRYDRMTGSTSSERSLLWRVWRRKEKDGDVSVDAIPGFTYDSRKDGYRKTSLLWRLFRYENDPEKGTAVDLLFIPVWRASRPSTGD